jgi:hypothetical protein
MELTKTQGGLDSKSHATPDSGTDSKQQEWINYLYLTSKSKRD